MKISSILVSQPKPSTGKSPYLDLAEKYDLRVDFRPFIHVEGISAKEFRTQRLNILDFSAIILTSRTSIDHFFRICAELRVEIPDTMKYFCPSESVSCYLQKYIVYRKRKIFTGKGSSADLLALIKKHNKEKFLLPVSDVHKKELPDALRQEKIKYKRAVMYRTVSSDLSDLHDVNYDILVFFSPSGISSLVKNFTNFKQGDTKIAAFGQATAKAIEKAKLRLDIGAPSEKAPSMVMALENFIKQCNVGEK